MSPANTVPPLNSANKGPLPLDSTLYDLDEGQQTFFKRITGIAGSEDLKQHIISVQAKAYELFPYPCIWHFTFAKLPISRLPYYEQALLLPTKHRGALFLDVGCCFGSDLRKIVFDGWPATRTIGSDVCPKFWEWGHDLYRTSPLTFPAGFVPGDAFSLDILSHLEPSYSAPLTPKPTELTSLTSLNPLQGHLSVIHASLFFHLFDEERQLDLARRIAGLLSYRPGSMIFGGHYGRPEKGTRTEVLADGFLHTQFWHSPESWRVLWEEQVFRRGSVRVDIERTVDELSFIEEPRNGSFYYMKWCITRL
ncbi:hypothetical protein P691DRAFT_708861 [Macrolepiota fuliginosa MF-IS2]|uniref:Methyltransferase domain-containing protein n=1 Tax=Macrolepiota fuliginosa MF-IS2 TaxID=1400762 RepID=A0A9P5X890_9AGAR|nr:hypothetical protein P691DRAFT_708861 [Macrolepiota fuliginosa MF-IS2]